MQIAIDSKEFALLGDVFTQDVVANYGSGVGVLQGLSAVERGLQESLAPVTTQHALSTTVIDVYGSSANSTTYFTASHFGRGVYEGANLYAYGKYVDDLVHVSGGYDSSKDYAWRIQNRTLIYTGPLIGNESIFLGSG
ncbi:hypothetical protein LTR36_001481 [Oleoguttula mirabilis]|uniref:SnoaL-like domain-containing protein n=1 Tax=Oleoguttula mirabilis TaxID=1507867 RepID=A0AAV9JNP2_9PEZI|nr:hypothetical protein LTR36_001481 [Oleoguttula mirabilis]